MKNKTEKGNAIIWILIAVALFAALGYAFSSTSRNSTITLTDTEAKSYANQIIAYGNELKAAVKRMSLRGIDETEFSFANAIDIPNNPAGHNPNCTSDRCAVFNPQGGQLTPVFFDGSAQVRVIGVDGVGTTEGELMLTIFGVDSNVCLKINQTLDVGTVGTLPATDSFTVVTYDGTYGTTPDPIGNTETSLSGQQSFCAEGAVAGNYHYHQVLIAR